MKNKIYILCLTADAKFLIFNVLKCDKIFEIQLQENFLNDYNKIIDTINAYDLVTLKSWFTLDIKLGIVTITFNKNNSFANSFNFDQDYLEKIIEKTDGFKNNINPKNFNFYPDSEQINIINNNNNSVANNASTTAYNKLNPSFSNKSNHSNTSGSYLENEKLSRSFNAKKDSGIANMKINNLGQSFIKSLFHKFVNDNLMEIKDFIAKNLNDKKNFLQKNFYEQIKSNYSNDADIRISINQDIYLFGCEDDHVKSCGYLKEFKNLIRTIEFIRDYSHVDQVNLFKIKILIKSLGKCSSRVLNMEKK